MGFALCRKSEWAANQISQRRQLAEKAGTVFRSRPGPSVRDWVSVIPVPTENSESVEKSSDFLARP